MDAKVTKKQLRWEYARHQQSACWCWPLFNLACVRVCLCACKLGGRATVPPAFITHSAAYNAKLDGFGCHFCPSRTRPLTRVSSPRSLTPVQHIKLFHPCWWHNNPAVIQKTQMCFLMHVSRCLRPFRDWRVADKTRCCDISQKCWRHEILCCCVRMKSVIT